MLLTASTHTSSLVLSSITTQLVDFFKQAFQGQQISVVPARYGQRILIGSPIPISQTHWHSRMIHSTGRDDITGNIGFAVFYVEEKRIWNRLDDKFDLEKVVIFRSIGKEKNPPEVFSFVDMIKQMPDFTRRTGINIFMEDVINSKLFEYFSKSPDWVATTCGSTDKSSFYIKI